MRRVIVVIPYLSIIEQNAKVYGDVFGPDAVLEHHSGAVTTSGMNGSAPEESENSASFAGRPIETENWDASMIVTTSVRFFESLFSNHPSNLRRIHNIARSVVVLDEVQTLPRRLLAPLLAMLRELTEDWGCSVVLSTATQPAFEASGPRQKYLWPAGSVTPIVPADAAGAMAKTLQRVRIEWELKAKLDWQTLAERLAEHPQVLCVLNLRDHVTAVYDALCVELGDADGLYHLSTRMCAQHRLHVLEEIRQRLLNGLPCRIVSTQLIEAGVDLDVPIAYRAQGPLDSIIQVAGRVDREGRATAAAGEPAGRLVVFVPEDERYPGKDYASAAVLTRQIQDEFHTLDACDLHAMREFFRKYYGSGDEASRGERLAAMRHDDTLHFASLANEFAIIDSRTVSVFVPYAEGAPLLQELQATRRMDLMLLRKLQRYTVSLQTWEFDAAKLQGLFEVWPDSDLWTCNEDQYNQEKGLLPSLPVGGYVQ